MRRALALFAALAAVFAMAASASADPVETVLQDDAVFLHSDDAGVRAALAQARQLGVDRIRVTAGWSVIAPEPDQATAPAFDATDPAAYPPDAWRNLDRLVRLATAAGLKLDIDIAFWAPRWATHDDPSATTRLRTQIDPDAYAKFAAAVARRYSGAYVPPAPASQATPAREQRDGQAAPDAVLLDRLLGGGAQQRAAGGSASADEPAPREAPLPAVDMFTIWNEPNHPGFILPQWNRAADGSFTVASAGIYRAMVRAAYPAIKAQAPGARVLIGGTASMGSSTPGKSGVPPLRFLRALACVDDRLRPIDTGDCAGYTTLPGDGWAHHPYSLTTLPNARPHDRDKVPVGALDRLAFTLRVLVRERRLAPADADLYLTEYGYETSPPDPKATFGPGAQARLLGWAEYLAERNPAVKMWPQFLLRDRPGDPAGPQMRPFGDWQTGLIYADGTPKPAAAAFRAPAFARCVGTGRSRQVMAWGRLRAGAPGADATLEAESPAGTYAPLATAASRRRGAPRAIVAQATLPGAPVVRYAPWRRGARYRIAWTAPDGTTAASAALAPVGCPGSDPVHNR